MSADVIAGSQWGDEGKGKIVDVFSGKYDVIVRYQGGSNAGHTVITGEKKYILHLLPSGILHSDKINIISHGVVVDINGLMEEIKGLQEKGIKITPKNFILSSNASVVLSYHKALDKGRENAKKGLKKIGTTGRGIGPAYTDKYSRTGIRIRDLYDLKLLREKLSENLAEKNYLLKFYGEKTMTPGSVIEELKGAAAFLRPFVRDTAALLPALLKKGKKVLFEGAQGALLDIDFGTYPYVTSSNPTLGGVLTGSGINYRRIGKVWGITKAYQTRVGNGPMPTEMEEPVHSRTREEGGEYGATTGRPRRCGWIDLVALKYVCEINGMTDIILTKLDVLSIFEKIKVCTAYIYKGRKTTGFMPDSSELEKCKPVYKTFKGWKKDITQARRYSDLPKEAKDYIRFIERESGVSVSLVSVGPDREQILSVVKSKE